MLLFNNLIEPFNNKTLVQRPNSFAMRWYRGIKKNGSLMSRLRSMTKAYSGWNTQLLAHLGQM
jgi:hypothetical protein